MAPPQPTFKPLHPPGPRLVRTRTYSALQLFQLFFTNSVIQTILQNTNDFGSVHHSTPSSPWTDLILQDMFSFMALVIFMGVVECSAFSDYWRGGKLYSFPFPRRVMTSKKFFRMCEALHLSSSEVNAVNKQRRGTAAFDRLGKIKPLYEELRDACRRNYHPCQEIAIDKKTVAFKAGVGLKENMKKKPDRWGYKLFVLADSKNGYTWDFFVSRGNSGSWLAYESVAELIDTRTLGTGYKLFVDHFYTSPVLFQALLQKKIWACGTIQTNTTGFPQTEDNSLDSESPRGSLRWIREDSLLFVQWRSTKDVMMCSTLHAAHAQDSVRTGFKGADEYLAPPAMKDYNRYVLYYKLCLKCSNMSV